jgi:hypothetical protein
MKGMATQNPFEGQKGTAKNAVFPDCLIGIGGTGWIVPARGGKMGGNRLLIKSDD